MVAILTLCESLLVPAAVVEGDGFWLSSGCIMPVVVVTAAVVLLSRGWWCEFCERLVGTYVAANFYL